MTPSVAACVALGLQTADELSARGLLAFGPEEDRELRAELVRGFQTSVAGAGNQGKGPSPAADLAGLSLAAERTTWREQYRAAVLRAMLPTVGAAS